MQVSTGIAAASERFRSHGLAGWLLERLQAVSRSNAGKKRQLQLLETLSVGGKRQVLLVACGNQRYLVGVGGDSVQTIVPVTGPFSDDAFDVAGTAL